METSTSKQNALALFHSDQIHRKRAEQRLDLEGYGHRCIGSPAKFPHSSEANGLGERNSNPSRHSETQKKHDALRGQKTTAKDDFEQARLGACRGQVVGVPVPQMLEADVEAAQIIFQKRISEPIVEHIVFDVPVPQNVEEIVETVDAPMPRVVEEVVKLEDLTEVSTVAFRSWDMVDAAYTLVSHRNFHGQSTNTRTNGSHSTVIL